MKVGIDLVETKRFENQPEHFFKKVFLTGEIAYCTAFKSPFEHFAGIFAAKESVMKALCSGIDEISFLDIEVLHEKNFAPKVRLKNTALEKAQNLGLEHFEISISHTKSLATAICIAT